jgi:hypothetical protein
MDGVAMIAQHVSGSTPTRTMRPLHLRHPPIRLVIWDAARRIPKSIAYEDHRATRHLDSFIWERYGQKAILSTIRIMTTDAPSPLSAVDPLSSPTDRKVTPAINWISRFASFPPAAECYRFDSSSRWMSAKMFDEMSGRRMMGDS